MNIIHKVTWKGMWKNRTRTLVTIFSVAMSAAMFMAVTTMVYSMWDFLVRGAIHELGDFYVQFDYSSDEQLEYLKQDENIQSVADVKVLGYCDFYDYYDDDLTFGIFRLSAVDDAFLKMMTIQLTEGRLPENSNEIVLPEDFNVRLEFEGKPTVAVGDTVTLELRTKLSSEEKLELLNDVPAEEFEKTYTVVGIMENNHFSADPEASQLYAMITLADGNEGDALWHRVYAKTQWPSGAYPLAREDYGESRFLHEELLSLYGVSDNSDTAMLLILAIAMILVVVIASVNPISNAFSISVSERTMQFGLLTGIGATKWQIRKSVRFEALVIVGISVPIGMVAGFCLTAAVLNRYGQQIAELYQYLASGVDVGVEFYAIPSWVIAVLTVLLCMVTILISTWQPARWATKITPIEAVRKSKEIRTRSEKLRVSGLIAKLFGLPGVLARKYDKISRRKYRATVIALSFSLVLFIAVNYLGDTLDLILDAYEGENYDFSCHLGNEIDLEAELEFVKSAPAVTEAKIMYKSIGTNKVSVPNRAFTDGYREILKWEGNLELPEDKQELPDGESSTRRAKVIYLEDSLFEEVLRSEGIDPMPYLIAEEPLAVTVKTKVESDIYLDENGAAATDTYYGAWLKEGAEIYLYENYMTIPEALRAESWADAELMISTGVTPKGETTLEAMVALPKEDGKLELVTVMTVLIEFATDGETGRLSCNYYAYDSEARARGELLLTWEDENAVIHVGESLENRPFGIHSEESETALILPMSQFPKDEADRYHPYIMVKSEDYVRTDTTLLAHMEESSSFSYQGLYEDSQYLRLMVSVSLVRFIINGLLILIALVCATNVFNTISANLFLRRRDFGMLKSIGMTDGEMNRMLLVECMSYIVKAFAISVPLGALICGVIYKMADSYLGTGVSVPWLMIAVGMAAVVLLVFVSNFYAAGKLRGESPIDAMRREN